MPDDPFQPERPTSRREAELARLAAEGQRRIQQATAVKVHTAQDAAASASEAAIRKALGAHYGSPARKAGYVLLGATPLMLILSVGSCFALGGATSQDTPTISTIFVGLIFACLLGGVVLLTVPGGSRARVAAERGWAMSLPFAMQGYFELLGSTAFVGSHVLISITFQSGREASPEMVQGLLGMLDTDAQTESRSGGTVIQIRSTALPTAWTDDEGRHGSNRQIVGYIHRLIEKVLLPLHDPHPIERISLTSEMVSMAEVDTISQLGVMLRKW